jgi:hypothetical protein
VIAKLERLLGALPAKVPPAQGPLVARLTGRSWWAVRYRDGREIAEWHGLDWSLLPRRGLVEVRLYCPSGQVAVLGNSQDASDRLLQCKVASAQAGGGGRVTRQTEQHIIGMLTGPNGEGTFYAWSYVERRLIGPVRDHYWMLQLGGIATSGGRLDADALGVSPD